MASDDIKSPELPSSARHRSLYKYTTPPWKETYRQKCREHLQNSRQRLLNKFRGISIETEKSQKEAIECLIKEIMEEEWKKLNNSFSDESLDETEDSFNELLSFMDSVQKELLEQEEKIVREYQVNLEIEESSVQESIKNLEENYVMCPVCQRNYLTQRSSTIICNCGLHIDTEQDCLSLENLKQQLQEGISSHNQNCYNIPKFSVTNCFEIVNLIMTCEVSLNINLKTVYC